MIGQVNPLTFKRPSRRALAETICTTRPLLESILCSKKGQKSAQFF